VADETGCPADAIIAAGKTALKTASTPAAFFIDFENVYYFLKNSPGTTREDVSDLVVKLIQRVRQYVTDTYQETAIGLDAYADFERIEENAQSALYLRGIETHNVLGTEHKNAADMKLCIDVMDTLYTRPHIESFILVAGDRDYIPVIRQLKKHGRTVRVVGFRESVSGDLLTNVGEQFFIDAAQFLPPSVPAMPVPAAPADTGPTPPTAERPAPAPLRVRELNDLQVRAVEIMFRHFADKKDIWMTPYLYKLRTEFPELSEWDRKQLISDLREAGAIRVEKRQGEAHDYSVIVVNWNHPGVRAVSPG
jgi:uncharacterized LabA/DUF88 family protein